MSYIDRMSPTIISGAKVTATLTATSILALSLCFGALQPASAQEAESVVSQNADAAPTQVARSTLPNRKAPPVSAQAEPSSVPDCGSSARPIGRYAHHAHNAHSGHRRAASSRGCALKAPVSEIAPPPVPRSASDVSQACSAGGPMGRWAVHPGEDLQDALKRWAETSKWRLIWNTEYSFQIAGGATFHGSFTDAVGALMTGMQEARPSPVVDVYRANCVFVVSDGLSSVR